MTTQFQKFRQLHQSEEPLLLGNVWNVQSAKIYQNLGFKAIGTSSAAVAQSLGYDDGENMPFDEYLFIIKRIIASINLPLTVDLEAGYGDNPAIIFENIKTLYEIGVVGVNLEDSILINGERRIVNEIIFADKLEKILNKLRENKIDIFINLRCDAFLLQLPNMQIETIKRIKLYESKGIDGVFLPYICNENDIKEVISNTSLPVNVMCMPNLANFEQLKQFGVKRISMGNSVNQIVYKKMQDLTLSIMTNQNFLPLF